jgi:tetratricopeptide (TPR) repeat protein
MTQAAVSETTYQSGQSAASTADLASLIEQALKCQQSGRLEDAVAIYDRILSARPDLAGVHCNRGVALAELGRLGDAGLAYLQAIARDPKFGDAYNNLGNVLCELGRFDDAENALQAAVTLKPEIPQYHSNLGTALKSQGKLAAAEAAFRQAVALDPNFADAHNNLGDLLRDLGRLDESERALRQAITLAPQSAEAFSNLGNTHKEQGKIGAAEAAYRQAIALRPNFAEAHSNLGTALLDLNRFQESEQVLRHAIELAPKSADAYSNLGNTLKQVGRLSEAEAACRRAIELKSGHAEAFFNLALTLQELQRTDEAIASFDQAIALKPNYPEAYFKRGMLLQQLNRFEDALASYDQAIALKPNYPEAFNNRGVSLHELRRLEEALASYDKGLELRPETPRLLTNRGLTLQHLRRLDEALASFQRAQAIRPDYADAHLNEALVRLLTGDYVRGWPQYEWRWRMDSLKSSRRKFSKPLWLGSESVEGKSILVHREQGFGDTIQFCRFVPLLAARGARVILEVEKPLTELMTNLIGVSKVIARGDPLPDFDFHCPLLSLPLAFGTRLETIPSATPYLHAPAVRTWQVQLDQACRPNVPRIGLVWSGRQQHKTDRDRSIRLRTLSPLLHTNATFLSLQLDVRPEDKAALQEYPNILHVGDALKDFSDTAAVVSQLDLVISVDTAAAHLAGALGRPVWILLPWVPDWRWLLEGNTSPWYPTARLFRQSEARKWANVINDVYAALSGFIDAYQPQPTF